METLIMGAVALAVALFVRRREVFAFRRRPTRSTGMAGEAGLALTNQRAVGGFNLGLLLVSVAGLTVSAVMVRSRLFGRRTAYLGVIAHALSLADYLREALTSSPLVALLVILPGALALGSGSSWSACGSTGWGVARGHGCRGEGRDDASRR
jgi:hypothetical protein